MSNIQKQHKISPAIAWLTIQKFIIFYCPLDGDELCRALKRESPDYDGNIEELFRAELYLISPLREPERFLQKEYFLTAQQRDIERQILKGIRAKHSDYYWFSGLPGTGKTLLLYDLAMKLSVRQRVCMIHCGESGEDWRILHKRLRRIDFLSDRQLSLHLLSLLSETFIFSPYLFT